ncbi:hypothetical protein CYMTET_21422 [Cymbomonas tetramitiformis]|uniref:CSD domain-containing protein n=1 Tax=Cymbomonas tetramitiformis TaxID=36881 RepID=A0AAE0L388_9CHLO|nr:hypothetical protein CYMTET_21422 [Cymbomonas tetramitiformis]
MAEAMTKQCGTVKWFNTQKGYGFITLLDTGAEVFVHQTAIHAEGFRSLQEGETVEFNLEDSEDGRTKAIDVTGPEGAFVQGAVKRYSYNKGGEGVEGGGGRGKGRGRGRGRGGRGRGRGQNSAPPAAEGAEGAEGGAAIMAMIGTEAAAPSQPVSTEVSA